MKQVPTLFLKSVILLISVGVLASLAWFPQTEGRATHLDLVSIYQDPLIIYMYIASIPFFVALFQAFKLLNYIDNNNFFSAAAIRSIIAIKYCALAIIGFLIVGILYIRFIVHGDDPAGPTMLGFIAIVTSAVVVSTASVFEKLLQNRVSIKSVKRSK